MNANLTATHNVTDTIGTAGTIAVTIDTTADEFAAWYGCGQDVPASVRATLDQALDAAQGYTDNDEALAALGLSVEKA